MLIDFQMTDNVLLNITNKVKKVIWHKIKLIIEIK